MEKQKLGPVVAPFAPVSEIIRSIAIVGAPTSIGIRTYDSGEPRLFFKLMLGWHISRAIALKRMAFCILLIPCGRRSSSELGHRSRALVEQLRSTVKTDEIEALETERAIAVKKNKLFTHKRLTEFIRRSAESLPLRRVIMESNIGWLVSENN